MENLMENLIEQLIEKANLMVPDRILISEIRGSDEVGMLLKAASGHDGVVTTIQAATPHR